jgi:hypothetical protein
MTSRRIKTTRKTSILHIAAMIMGLPVNASQNCPAEKMNRSADRLSVGHSAD